MWNIQHYQNGRYHLFLIKAGFVRPTQWGKWGDHQMPRSGGFGGCRCLRACPQHTMEIMLQWPPCPSTVGRVGQSHVVKELDSRCPEVCTRLFSPTEATNKNWKASQSTQVYEMLLFGWTSCGLLMFSWEISHNEACVYLKKRKGKILMQSGERSYKTLSNCLLLV